MANNKYVMISNVILLISKLKEHKLNGSNFFIWIRQTNYLKSIDKWNHLINEPIEEEIVIKTWLQNDARLFSRIKNYIDSKMIGLINQCDTVVSVTFESYTS